MKRQASKQAGKSAARSSKTARPRTRAAAKARSPMPELRKAAPSQRVEEAEAHTTTDLDEIRAWAERRGGQPATVKGTAPEHEAGLLRIDFPGYAGEDKLEHISWEEWYQKFEEKKLAFLYQEKTADGKESRFFKLVSRK